MATVLILDAGNVSIVAQRRRKEMKKAIDWTGLTLCIFVLVFVLFYANDDGDTEGLLCWTGIGLISLFGIVRGVKGLIGKPN